MYPSNIFEIKLHVGKISHYYINRPIQDYIYFRRFYCTFDRPGRFVYVDVCQLTPQRMDVDAIPSKY